ncbi:MAG: leucine-rich repeat domain-containing protein, partial [Oscillospiraceae bacterium]|nr:leucine-rich repeat domain-containing protein [Oscillospiraceae bacterium]
NCARLEQISIPDSVTYIGRGAFAYCMSLKSLNISDNVRSIDNSAFFRCSVLESVIIPDGVETIGPGAFASCYKLSSITIPDSVKTIEKEAFCFCKSLHLESIIVPDSVESIDDLAFSECRHSVVYYPSTASVGYNCFYKTKAAVKYEVRDGKAYITEITGDTDHIVFPDKISGHEVVYEDVSSGAGIYESSEII